MNNPFPSPQPVVIAVVIPIYNEAAVLPTLWMRLSAVIDSLPNYSWRVVFVNDGSHDASPSIIRNFEHPAGTPHCTLIELSRNFGHQAALTAGLNAAQGCDAVITMDADLQDPPELIPDLVAAWQGGAEVVLAVRKSREDRGLRRVGFDVFHQLFALVSDFELQPNTGTFGLLARPALGAFARLQEKHRFFPGLRAWVGFTQAEVIYDRKNRAAGTPAQTLRRLVRYGMDGLLSFSRLPLRLVTYAGLLIAGCGFAIGLFFITRRLLGQEIAFTGFTTLVTLVLFLGGVQLVGIGVLGEYLGRIYEEVKQRPLYIIKSTHEK